MNEFEAIKDAIREIAKPRDTYSIVCTVSDIDVTNKLCNCTPINGEAVLMNVRLSANNNKGFMLIPKNDSIVVVTLINNTTGYVAMCSEVDEVWLNGNNYNGIVKIDEQTAKLNQLVAELQAQLVLIATGITGAGGTYTPGTLSQFAKSDYENTTIKNGNGS